MRLTVRSSRAGYEGSVPTGSTWAGWLEPGVCPPHGTAQPGGRAQECMDISAISKKALSHGLGSIEEGGGPLIPFSMVLDESNPDPGERVLSLTRHVAE